MRTRDELVRKKTSTSHLKDEKLWGKGSLADLQWSLTSNGERCSDDVGLSRLFYGLQYG